jgi:tetrapyrrole methylase family protein/MazG family protein
MSEHPDFDHLVDIVARLRGEDGCPWDREQTHESIKPCLIEESYEVIEAVENNDNDGICEELGDVLLHIVFHSEIAAERGAFDIDDVVRGIVKKMISRHPHVFGEGKAKTTVEVLEEWERIKLREKRDKKGEASLLDGLPMSMSALLVAQRMQEKAARIGFDWPNIEPVWAKIVEEMEELKEAYKEGDRTKIEEELGDFMFAITNLARFLDMSSEMALRGSINKFKRRFAHVEKRAREEGLDMPSLEVLDSFWDEAKEIEKREN